MKSVLGPVLNGATAPQAWFSAAVVLAAALFTGGIGTQAAAQVVSATLTGSVTDSSGASVPNATVRAIDLSTRAVQTTTTTARRREQE